MKESLHAVTKQITDLIHRNGSITLFELEQALDVSYNLLFLAIDNMVTNNELKLTRCGKDYLLTGTAIGNKLPIDDGCVNEYLCQDV